MAVLLSIASMAAANAANDAQVISDEPVITSDGTYLYARKDDYELMMDVYHPAEGSETVINGKTKPTILFMFGGGFMEGNRNKPKYLPWFKEMTENGYRIITIDYRLGMKNLSKKEQNNLILFAKATDRAIHMAVEDLFTATLYIMENAEALNVDPNNIVTCGTSAGAISVMQAEYEICNKTSYSEVLPEGFNYAGVMSYSGGIFVNHKQFTFKNEPAPILMFHGTIDKVVNYTLKGFDTFGLWGTDKIVKNLKKNKYNYKVYRYINHSHEIATTMNITTRFQYDFLERNVMEGRDEIIDAYVDDPTIEMWVGDLNDMFSGN